MQSLLVLICKHKRTKIERGETQPSRSTSLIPPLKLFEILPNCKIQNVLKFCHELYA